jgi:mannonate dehydratase
MNRRRFLRTCCMASALAVAGCDLDFRRGIRNACLDELPDALHRHPLVTRAWQGLAVEDVWDVHCHLFGNGDSGRGLWLNPRMRSLLAPGLYAQHRFYMNAACLRNPDDGIDAGVVSRLADLCERMPAGFKTILLAFDWARDEQGQPMPDRSTFYVPDQYASEVAASNTHHFEWAASIHPYDPDALVRLEFAHGHGARAIKWLPSAQNIDPASPRCDAFYRRLAALRIPLLTHGGDERAVRGQDESLGNPLKLRRPLDLGVIVIVAHCASLGIGRDLDRGADGPPVPNFELFARLMESNDYHDHLFADVSATVQANRMSVLSQILERTDWHPRLLNGSDYPLPGVVPVVSLDGLARRELIDPSDVAPLAAIREHNALLFDFVLKRTVAWNGHRFADSVFTTRRFFENEPKT